MSHDGSINIKTIRDNETKISIVDGASGSSATKKLSVVQDAELIGSTNNYGIPCMIEDKDGNYQILKQNSNGKLDVEDNPLTDAGATPDRVLIGDGTDTLAISATGEASVSVTKAQAADGATAPVEALQVAGKDGSGNLQVLSTDTSGKLNVNATVAVVTPANQVIDFQEQVGQAVGTEKLFFYVVPNGKTFYGNNFKVGSDGKVMIKYGLSPLGVALTTKLGQFFQQPKVNQDNLIPSLTLLGDGTAAVCITVTPQDGAADDIYVTLQGYLV